MCQINKNRERNFKIILILIILGTVFTSVFFLSELAYKANSSKNFFRLPESIVISKSILPKSLGQFDPKLGWKLKPNEEAYSYVDGTIVRYKINSKGFRDNEFSYQKKAGVFRILLLGDSETFGYGLPLHKHFSKIIEGYFKNVEVINLGVSGYGVDQELILLKNEGFKYQADLVIVGVFHYKSHRHMYSERFGKSKPHFIIENDTLLLRNSPCLKREKIKDRSIYFQKERKANVANKKNPEFLEKMRLLGGRILLEMQKEVKKQGGEFLLLTRESHLCQFSKDNKILHIGLDDALRNRFLGLKEPFKHRNEAGSGIIAWEIKRFLEKENFPVK